jgi:uncharacterized protein YbjT (DUF2867 family)
MSATILLTGATGYVRGRLLRRLEREDVRVRCLTRRRQAVQRLAAPSSEVVVGDLLDPDSLTAAMADVDIAQGPEPQGHPGSGYLRCHVVVCLTHYYYAPS